MSTVVSTPDQAPSDSKGVGEERLRGGTDGTGVEVILTSPRDGHDGGGRVAIHSFTLGPEDTVLDRVSNTATNEAFTSGDWSAGEY